MKWLKALSSNPSTEKTKQNPASFLDKSSDETKNRRNVL
jgi:hypothetical protein